jgi:hypothetical protein
LAVFHAIKTMGFCPTLPDKKHTIQLSTTIPDSLRHVAEILPIVENLPEISNHPLGSGLQKYPAASLGIEGGFAAP